MIQKHQECKAQEEPVMSESASSATPQSSRYNAQKKKAAIVTCFVEEEAIKHNKVIDLHRMTRKTRWEQTQLSEREIPETFQSVGLPYPLFFQQQTRPTNQARFFRHSSNLMRTVLFPLNAVFVEVVKDLLCDISIDTWAMKQAVEM